MNFEELHSSPTRAAEIFNEICTFLGVDTLSEEEWGAALDVIEPETSSAEELPEVSAELLLWLKNFYRVPNEELFRLIGRRFDWT